MYSGPSLESHVFLESERDTGAAPIGGTDDETAEPLPGMSLQELYPGFYDYQTCYHAPTGFNIGGLPFRYLNSAFGKLPKLRHF